MIELLIIIFILGCALIAFEYKTKISKATIALITVVLYWTVYILLSSDKYLVNEQLTEHLGELSSILFFYMERLQL
jgi:uncharacterized membrane protein YphA (DoxX/SURF4 family)